MPDEFGERTEPATPRRRIEARQRGQVPRSHELTTAMLLLGLLLLLKYFGPGVWHTLLSIVYRGLSTGQTDRGQLAPFSRGVALDAFRAVAPLLGIAFILALAVTAAQVGWLVTLHPLTPSLAKINPLNGLRRMFSSRSLVTLAINTVKLALVAAVAWLTISGQIHAILAAIDTDHAVLLARAADLTYTLGVRLALLLVVLAIIDYVYQRYRHERDLRMTKEEVKEELRRMEGDPILKRRRRQVQMQLAMQRVRSAVPQADVVVTNPTHLAIAIQYDADKMNAPVVVAKGADYLALRIRELAAAHGIPMVERPTLARLMYDAVEVGKEVPSRFYQAIAEILAYVYELTGRRMGPAPVAV
jgi:flagellar biosynthetic protein FlhB